MTSPETPRSRATNCRRGHLRNSGPQVSRINTLRSLQPSTFYQSIMPYNPYTDAVSSCFQLTPHPWIRVRLDTADREDIFENDRFYLRSKCPSSFSPERLIIVYYGKRRPTLCRLTICLPMVLLSARFQNTYWEYDRSPFRRFCHGLSLIVGSERGGIYRNPKCHTNLIFYGFFHREDESRRSF